MGGRRPTYVLLIVGALTIDTIKIALPVFLVVGLFYCPKLRRYGGEAECDPSLLQKMTERSYQNWLGSRCQNGL